jgi:hypothetical protein
VVSVTVVAITPLVDLCAELSPRTPRPVLETLVVEKLDVSACMILDVEWAEARQHLASEAIVSAHSQHIGSSYLERRRAEALDAARRPGDYTGQRGQVA